jgi:hypothetical protein
MLHNFDPGLNPALSQNDLLKSYGITICNLIKLYKPRTNPSVCPMSIIVHGKCLLTQPLQH